MMMMMMMIGIRLRLYQMKRDIYLEAAEIVAREGSINLSVGV